MKRQREYKEIYSDKSKTLGQKEVEQMKRTREMSNEERKQSKKKQSKKTEQSSDEDIVQKLKDLNELYKSGALTDEEFTKAKNKLLN